MLEVDVGEGFGERRDQFGPGVGGPEVPLGGGTGFDGAFSDMLCATTTSATSPTMGIPARIMGSRRPMARKHATVYFKALMAK